MEFRINEITRISVIIVLILNFFIIFTEIRYIEYIHFIIFLIYNLYLIGITVEKYHKNTYDKSKEIENRKKILFIGTNILIFFYIFKEPYFFLSKYKISILLGSILTGYSILIFIQKIKIKLSLKFFKEIIKMFLISGIIYYFPIICIQIFFNIFLKIF